MLEIGGFRFGCRFCFQERPLAVLEPPGDRTPLDSNVDARNRRVPFSLLILFQERPLAVLEPIGDRTSFEFK
jgi:hypothetical protein